LLKTKDLGVSARVSFPGMGENQAPGVPGKTTFGAPCMVARARPTVLQNSLTRDKTETSELQRPHRSPQGLKNPSSPLIENYKRAHQHEETASPHSALQKPTGPSKVEQEPSGETQRMRPHPSSESNLEPTLRQRGELQRPAGRRKAGRGLGNCALVPCARRCDGRHYFTPQSFIHSGDLWPQ
jgi:hypothetical protein